MRANLLEQHARENAGMSDEWTLYLYECLPLGRPTQVYKLAGAVAPLFASGKSKGCRNWRMKDRSTQQTVYISPADHERWLTGWEAKSGKCSQCDGAGQTIAGCHVDTGPRYRTCGRCGGSGIPKTEEVTA